MLFLKCSSTSTVHHYREEQQINNNIEPEETRNSNTCLTVWRKSLLFNCNGFTVFGPDGSLAYRVDNYYSGRPRQITLMDGEGNPIFTICRRKKLWLANNDWLIYEGDVDKFCKKKKPIFCARKKLNFIQKKLGMIAHVYGEMHNTTTTKSFLPKFFGWCGKRHIYSVEGSYSHRSCKIFDESRSVVGEIKTKDTKTGGAMSFGSDIFHLNVKSGIESTLAMAIVLLLDQMSL